MLTLDRYVQREAERLLNQAVVDSKASGGLILIMEPRTGNILAAANNPTLQPDRRSDLRSAEADRTSPRSSPTSTSLGRRSSRSTMSAAIDQGVVTPDTTFQDTGIAVVGGAVIHNWNGAATAPAR